MDIIRRLTTLTQLWLRGCLPNNLFHHGLNINPEYNSFTTTFKYPTLVVALYNFYHDLIYTFLHILILRACHCSDEMHDNPRTTKAFPYVQCNYLKLRFEEIKNGCGDDALNTTSIDAENSDQVSICWGLNL